MSVPPAPIAALASPLSVAYPMPSLMVVAVTPGALTAEPVVGSAPVADPAEPADLDGPVAAPVEDAPLSTPPGAPAAAGPLIVVPAPPLTGPEESPAGARPVPAEVPAGPEATCSDVGTVVPQAVTAKSSPKTAKR